jgi:hypothetical protein
MIIVCVYIAAGQPARGPEQGSVKVFNSPYSARNIVIFNSRLSNLTMYDKTRKSRGNTSCVPRVLPDELGQLLAQYIVYISLFSRLLD